MINLYITDLQFMDLDILLPYKIKIITRAYIRETLTKITNILALFKSCEPCAS